MSDPISVPPIYQDPHRNKDTDHLNLLSIFHFVFAGFSLIGIAFMFLHYFIMTRVMKEAQHQASPPPEFLMNILGYVYIFCGIAIVVLGTLNLLSGIFLRQRKNRLFSLVIAGINCLNIPVGTILGVFTFMVLTRESVRQLYLANQPH